MPNITFYIPQYIADKVKKEDNQSALVSRLLANHYATKTLSQPFGKIDKPNKDDEIKEEE